MEYGLKTNKNNDIDVAVHVFSNYNGNKEGIEIVENIIEALRVITLPNYLEITSYTNPNYIYVGDPNPDITHIVLTMTYRIIDFS